MIELKDRVRNWIIAYESPRDSGELEDEAYKLFKEIIEES